MYLVKTYLAQSKIAGIGVFAAEDVSPGTIVWKYARGFDQSFAPAQFEQLPRQAQEFMRTYTYFSEGAYHLDGDHGRFTNHADEPNTGFDERRKFVARRAIRKGEEITSDYREFDANWRDKLAPAVASSAPTSEADPSQGRAETLHRVWGLLLAAVTRVTVRRRAQRL